MLIVVALRLLLLNFRVKVVNHSLLFWRASVVEAVIAEVVNRDLVCMLVFIRLSMLVLLPLVVLELRIVLVFNCHLRVQCTDAMNVVLGLLLLLLVHSHLVLGR